MNAIDELRMRQAAPKLLRALRALLQQTGNIEVLGEWEALDMNHSSRKKVRATVDQVIADARAAIAEATKGAAPAPQGGRLIADLDTGAHVALRAAPAAPLRPFGIEFDPEDERS